MFVKVTNGTPKSYTVKQLRRDNPNISFPKEVPAETLSEYDVYPVNITPPPVIDHKTHHYTQGFQLVDGDWEQTWSVFQLPQNEAENNTRSHRNRILQETDYLALSDNTMSASMTTYRQALRDITDQEGFPFSVTWPTKP